MIVVFDYDLNRGNAGPDTAEAVKLKLDQARALGQLARSGIAWAAGEALERGAGVSFRVRDGLLLVRLER